MNDRHVAIIAFTASGTNAIFDQILNNKNVYFHMNKEPLNCSTSTLKDENTKIKTKIHWYNDHIMRYIRAAETECKKLVIHIKPTQLRELNIPFVDAISILSEKFDFVLVERHNYLAMRFSGLAKKLRHREIEMLATDFSFVPAKTINVPVERLYRWLVNTDKQLGVIKTHLSNKRCITISYENDINVDLRKTVDYISKELGFYDDYVYESMTGSPHATKNKWSAILLKDKIENYDEVVAHLKNTEYEWMVYE